MRARKEEDMQERRITVQPAERRQRRMPTLQEDEEAESGGPLRGWQRAHRCRPRWALRKSCWRQALQQRPRRLRMDGHTT